MTDSVGICNIALAGLGQPRISSLTNPASETEELCALLYPISRDSVLEEHLWSFAMARRTLNPTGIDPDWGDDIQYQVPADVVQVFRLYKSPKMTDPIAPEFWRREGDYVMVSTDAAYALCTVRITDANKFPALVAGAVAARLRMELAVAITHDPDTYTLAAQEYATKVREAAAADGLQARREVFRSKRLTGVRNRA